MKDLLNRVNKDSDLNTADKIGLMKFWIKRINEKIMTTIMDSDELKKLNRYKSEIKSALKNLLTEMQNNETE